MLSFICRVNGNVLWSLGNYQYEIDYADGRKERFEASYEEAVEKISCSSALV